MPLKNTSISRPAFWVICDYCKQTLGTSEFHANGSAVEDLSDIKKMGWFLKGNLVVCPKCKPENRLCPQCSEPAA